MKTKTMMTLQWHSCPGESLPGKDVAARIAFLPRSGVTATAVCSVAHKFADAGTGLYCGSLRRPSSDRRIGSQRQVAYPGFGSPLIEGCVASLALPIESCTAAGTHDVYQPQLPVIRTCCFAQH
jgi:hypothetical protein